MSGSALCLLTAASLASEFVGTSHVLVQSAEGAYGSKQSASHIRQLRGGSVESALAIKEDRYGGVEASIVDGASPLGLDGELASHLAGWRAAGKQGIWLKVPRASSAFLGSAVLTHGFNFHHATPDYALLTLWLPDTPSPVSLILTPPDSQLLPFATPRCCLSAAPTIWLHADWCGRRGPQ